MAIQTFIGTGKVLIAKIGADAAGFKDTGNCTKAEYSVQTETKEVRNARVPGGSTYDSLDRTKSGELTLDLVDWSDENLAMALGASIANIAAGTSTNEVATVLSLDSYVFLAKVPSAITSVKSVDGLTTYTAGDDYVIDPAGLYIPADSGITLGDIHVTYSYGKQSTLDILKNTGKEFQIGIAGLNEVRTAEKHRARFYRAKVSPSNMSFISDDFGVISVKFTLLSDSMGNYGGFDKA